MSNAKPDKKITAFGKSILTICVIFMTFLLGACDWLLDYGPHTLKKLYEFEKLELQLPRGGALSVELLANKWSYFEAEGGDSETIAVKKGPYSLLMFFRYARGTEGVVKVKSLWLGQEKHGNEWSYTDLPDEPLEFSKGRKLNQAPYLIKDIDFEYDEIRMILKAVIEIEGHGTEEVEIDQIIKTDYRERRVNDIFQRMMGV